MKKRVPEKNKKKHNNNNDNNDNNDNNNGNNDNNNNNSPIKFVWVPIVEDAPLPRTC